MKENKKKIFIVHSSKDKKIGELLCNAFVKMGIKEENIFYSSKLRDGARLGQNFITSSKGAITKCDLMILLISKNLYSSPYCMNEIGASWVLDKIICPIIIDDSDEIIQGFLQDNIAIKWNANFSNSKQILELLHKNVGIEINEYNLYLLENVRKFLQSKYTKPTIENITQFTNLSTREKKKLNKAYSKFSEELTQQNYSLEKQLNTIFSSKIFKDALFDSAGNDFSYDIVVTKMAGVLLYYLYTRDSRVSYNFLLKIMNDVDTDKSFLSKELVFDGLKYVEKTEDEKVLSKKLLDNVINHGYVTHSFNPIYLKSIMENGLGEKFDSESEKNLNDLEKSIYKNPFLTRQELAKFYYSLPSANSLHYACAMSPEKVFGGPLKILSKKTNFNKDITVDEMLPIKVGEKLKHYYKRVGYNNLKIVTNNYSYFNSFIIKLMKKKIKKLVNDFCFDYSYILLIPIEHQGKIVNSYNNSVDSLKNSQNLLSYIKNNAYGIGIDFDNINNFDQLYTLIRCITPNKIGILDESLMSNLCSAKNIQITDDFYFIRIPVYYSLLQEYCKRRFLIGTKIVTELSPYYQDKKYKIVKK